jgi:hypothetical protein
LRSSAAARRRSVAAVEATLQAAAGDRLMSGTDDRGPSAHLALGIWHLMVPLAAILLSFYVEQPHQNEPVQLKADLRKSMVGDKIRFIEERIKFGSVLETDVLRLMGSPDRTSEEPSQTASPNEDRRYRVLMWRIGEQEVWGVFVKDGLVSATWGPGPASLPLIATRHAALAGAAEKR